MRFPTLALAAILAAAVPWAAPAAGATDSPAPRTGIVEARSGARPLPAMTEEAPERGTPTEALRYARREAASPEVQDYAGGEVVVVVGFFGACLFLLFLAIIVD